MSSYAKKPTKCTSSCTARNATRTTNNEQRTTPYFRAPLRRQWRYPRSSPPCYWAMRTPVNGSAAASHHLLWPPPITNGVGFVRGRLELPRSHPPPFSLISATRPAPPSPSFSMCSTKFRWAFLESLSRTTRRRDGDRGSPWARRDRPGPGS